MSTLLLKLKDYSIWEEYLQYKKNQNLFSKKEEEKFMNFISNREYINIVDKIIEGKYTFSIPEKHLINKMNKSKKRVVYTFNEEEMYILKVINYLVIKKYDGKFCNNCYSFRNSKGVKEALYTITKTKNINNMCSYKIDVENYFNSVPVNRILPLLHDFFYGDEMLYNVISKILLNNKVRFNDTIIEEEKGIMAGVPISAFLANLYLKDMDEYFYNQKILYARYSDDIIIFAPEDKIGEYKEKLNTRIFEHDLSINENKRVLTGQREKWSFLGFSYQDGIIDISDITKKKVKGKIKKASKKLRRWMLKKGATCDRAVKAMNRKFNKKFYGYDEENAHNLNWSKWFFPLINTDKGLKEIDLYMQQNLRYICTGRHNKKNYEIKYDFLKDCGYRPLVSSYYKGNV